MLCFGLVNRTSPRPTKRCKRGLFWFCVYNIMGLSWLRMHRRHHNNTSFSGSRTSQKKKLTNTFNHRLKKYTFDWPTILWVNGRSALSRRSIPPCGLTVAEGGTRRTTSLLKERKVWMAICSFRYLAAALPPLARVETKKIGIAVGLEKKSIAT